MRKRFTKFSISVLIILIIAVIALQASSVEGNAGTNYIIEHVDHMVETTYNGYVLINDTIRITGQAEGGFLLGFPYKYGPYVLHCLASNSTDSFPVKLDVTLEDHVGFYAIRVDFPHGTPQIFSVKLLLSNSLLTQDPQNMSFYTLDFPAYPGLTKPAAKCNSSIVLPDSAEYVNGTVDTLTYGQQNLTAFTCLPASVTFLSAGDEMLIVNVKEFEREIRISGVGEIEGSDTYYITNKAYKETSFLEIFLPPSSYDVFTYDQFGRKMSQPTQIEETDLYMVFFTLPIKADESSRFTVKYHLSADSYITQEGSNIFNFNLPLSQNVNYFIWESTTTFVLPEGAKLLGFEGVPLGNTYSVVRGTFQETLIVDGQGQFLLGDLSVGVEYLYNSMWLAFRPVLWSVALSIIGCAVAIFAKRPRAPVSVTVPTVAMRLRREHIESFVDVYERRRKILLDVKSLETRARKGKMPRRRYKIRRKTLETRLASLSRSLTEMKEKLRSAGGRYADLMRQLEVAETEINEIETNIVSIENRHLRADLSLGAYQKLLADYKRRKEKAETAIDGILIRLREEIS